MSVILVMSDRKLRSGDDTVFIFRKKTVDLRNKFVNLLSASSGIVLRLKMGFYLLLGQGEGRIVFNALYKIGGFSVFFDLFGACD